MYFVGFRFALAAVLALIFLVVLYPSDPPVKSAADRKRIAIIGKLNSPSYQLLCFFRVFRSSPTFRPECKRLIPNQGAGSAGTSTAYYLARYENANAAITLFEQNGYIGGRSTTVNAYDDPSHPVELGASIFVSVNYNLVSAAKSFGLNVSSDEEDEDADSATLGIFDGNQMLFMIDEDDRFGGWWDKFKFVYRYGLTTMPRTRRLTSDVVGRFLKMYSSPIFPFASITEAAAEVGLLGVTGSAGREFLDANGLSGRFVEELIQASTRVNYGQNLGAINGLGTMVCMATEGAMSVDGGNWQIFSGMANASGAAVRLNSRVSKIMYESSRRIWQVTSMSKEIAPPPDQNSIATPTTLIEEFDQVVLAAPYHSSNLEISPKLDRPPEQVPYVTLHVTLFTSRFRLDPAYFGLPPNARVPTNLLTTLNQTELRNDGPDPTTPLRVGNVGFFSISKLRTLTTAKRGREHLYKIFSPEEFGDDRLADIFGSREAAEKISWKHRHVVCSPFPPLTFFRL